MTRQSTPGDAARRIVIRERWESATRWALIALSIAFTAAYSLLVLTPSSPDMTRAALVGILVLSWATFITDFAVRLGLTPAHERGSYVRRHRIDLASVILPLVRPFQLLGALRLLPGFRGDGGNALRSRVITAAATYAGVFVYLIALTVLAVERPAPHSTIHTFGQAIWWSCVTIATVGYGDYTPVTAAGRVLAVILMAGGLVIIGTSSAIIVSYLSERIVHRRPPAGPDEGHSNGDAGEPT